MSLSDLQKQLQILYQQRQKEQNPPPLYLNDRSGISHTTRSKANKKNCIPVDYGPCNKKILINRETCIATVDPKVTMEALTIASLSHGLIAPVIPEFKEITVSGAILGGAAESSSHHWGTFNDCCVGYEILCGNGTILKVTASDNPEIFYGIAGSYGSLGPIISVDIQLIAAKKYVLLKYTRFSDPSNALKKLKELCHSSSSDFLEGIIFRKDFAVVIEGIMSDTKPKSSYFSTDPFYQQWYYQHVENISVYEEAMDLKDYLFRYDLGAFWMGAYLFRLPFLYRLISEGIFHFSSSGKEGFTRAEIEQFYSVNSPPFLMRSLMRPLLASRPLWKILHHAEKWVQNRFLIQDCCIPESEVSDFLQGVLQNIDVFPLWLCPVKGTRHPQWFSPHFLPVTSQDSHFINIGIYGLPHQAAPIPELTRNLEAMTHLHKGRKVLYSHSYYTHSEFWSIYPEQQYLALRRCLFAEKMWQELTDKVLFLEP